MYNIFIIIYEEDTLVKLRLTRMGRHKRAFYRIVAVDSRTKAAGGYIELLGHLDPITEEIKLSEDAILKWLSEGAQPSDTVKNILKQHGIWAKFVKTRPTAKPAVKKAAKPATKTVAKPAATKTTTKTATKPAVKKTTSKK